MQASLTGLVFLILIILLILSKFFLFPLSFYCPRLNSHQGGLQ
jgi:hypothetical protein